MLPAINNEQTQEKFVKLYSSIHKIADQEDARNLFEIEVFHFEKHFEENPALQKCTELSQKAAFLEIISSGLSFDKSQKHFYLYPSITT